MKDDNSTRSAERRPYRGTPGSRARRDGPDRYRDEVYSKRISAGRRTYFFDVIPTRSGKDFFIVVTESKRVDEFRYEKHKIRLYKEDFAKVMRGLYETIEHVRQEHLPDFEFHGMPKLVFPPPRDADE